MAQRCTNTAWVGLTSVSFIGYENVDIRKHKGFVELTNSKPHKNVVRVMSRDYLVIFIYKGNRVNLLYRPYY